MEESRRYDFLHDLYHAYTEVYHSDSPVIMFDKSGTTLTASEYVEWGVERALELKDIDNRIMYVISQLMDTQEMILKLYYIYRVYEHQIGDILHIGDLYVRYAREEAMKDIAKYHMDWLPQFEEDDLLPVPKTYPNRGSTPGMIAHWFEDRDFVNTVFQLTGTDPKTGNKLIKMLHGILLSNNYYTVKDLTLASPHDLVNLKSWHTGMGAKLTYLLVTFLYRNGHKGAARHLSKVAHEEYGKRYAQVVQKGGWEP